MPPLTLTGSPLTKSLLLKTKVTVDLAGLSQQLELLNLLWLLLIKLNKLLISLNNNSLIAALLITVTMVAMVVTRIKPSDTSNQTPSQLKATILTLLLMVNATSLKLNFPLITQSLATSKSRLPLGNLCLLLRSNQLLFPSMLLIGVSTLVESFLIATTLPTITLFSLLVSKMEHGLSRTLGVLTGVKKVTLDLKMVTHAVLPMFLIILLHDKNIY